MTLDTRYSGKELPLAVLGLTTVLYAVPLFGYFVLFYNLFTFIFGCGETNVNSPLAIDYSAFSQTLGRYNFDEIISNFIKRAEIYTVIYINLLTKMDDNCLSINKQKIRWENQLGVAPFALVCYRYPKNLSTSPVKGIIVMRSINVP